MPIVEELEKPILTRATTSLFYCSRRWRLLIERKCTPTLNHCQVTNEEIFRAHVYNCERARQPPIGSQMPILGLAFVPKAFCIREHARQQPIESMHLNQAQQFIRITYSTMKPLLKAHQCNRLI